jgi:hypothetical protein
MAALATEAELMDACRDLTWWQGADGGWHLEWRDGPYASEVASVLAVRLGGSASETACDSAAATTAGTVPETVQGAPRAAGSESGFEDRSGAGRATGDGATVADPGTPGSAAIDVMGVRFALRAIDPLGRARVLARPGLWRFAEVLDTTRRPTSGRPWEQLLGG